jgi:hypothetical protein
MNNIINSLQNFNEICYEELAKTLNNVYPMRDDLQKLLLETHNEDLLDKIIVLNKIIKDAEILLSKQYDIKNFYADTYPEYVDKGNEINEVGIKRISTLKKKWKTLGYLRNNS